MAGRGSASVEATVLASADPPMAGRPEDASPSLGVGRTPQGPPQPARGPAQRRWGQGATHLSGHPGHRPVTTRFRPHPQRPGWPDTASCPFRRRARSARRQSETRAGASGASADCRHAASPASLLFLHGTRYGPRGLPGPVRPRLDPVSHAKTPFTNGVPPIGADEEGVGGQGPRTGPAPLEPPTPNNKPLRHFCTGGCPDPAHKPTAWTPEQVTAPGTPGWPGLTTQPAPPATPLDCAPPALLLPLGMRPWPTVGGGDRGPLYAHCPHPCLCLRTGVPLRRGRAALALNLPGDGPQPQGPP